jgi:acetoin utilization deacetylase AcuC-like enzyme
MAAARTRRALASVARDRHPARMSPPLAFWSKDYACDIGPHVFPTEKYALVRDRLVAEGRLAANEIAEPPLATRSELESVHTRAYLDDLEQLRWTPRTAPSELPLSAEIVTAYRRAAAGTRLAARAALERGSAIHIGGGFHHACADHAEGFCYLNDVAVAIRAMQRERAIERAAVVDLDVHQGNGTADIFSGDRSVFTLSVHQEANYPVPKARSSLDVGLDDGTGDDAYDRALERALIPVWAFEPQLIVYVAGADPYVDDQLGGLALTFDGLERRDRRVLDGCAERGIPVAVTLAGGYARNHEDTVRIHVLTCRLALALAKR